MAETRRHPEFLAGWLASLQPTAIANLGCLREWPNVEVCEEDDQLVWLRGPHLEERLLLALRSLLGCQIFRSLEDGQLVPENATLPQGHVPHGRWTSLQRWLTISVPTKRFAAPIESKVAISLARSARIEMPSLLRISMTEWSSYANTAPQLRLERLQFAASHQQAILVGEPLPPIRGDTFYVRQGVAVPVGFDWQPALDARVLRRAFGLGEGDIALLLPEGGCCVIRSDQFCGATRSAVRLTAGGRDAES